MRHIIFVIHSSELIAGTLTSLKEKGARTGAAAGGDDSEAAQRVAGPRAGAAGAAGHPRGCRCPAQAGPGRGCCRRGCKGTSAAGRPCDCADAAQKSVESRLQSALQELAGEKASHKSEIAAHQSTRADLEAAQASLVRTPLPCTPLSRVFIFFLQPGTRHAHDCRAASRRTCPRRRQITRARCSARKSG